MREPDLQGEADDAREIEEIHPSAMMSSRVGFTKGRDVGMAVAQGETRPIREVLAEQKKNHNAQGKALREEAFRERAGMQAMLASCLCCYPLVVAGTESGHEEWCPSHGMHLSRKEVERLYGEGRTP